MERIKTGIKGFDNLIEGGFPKGSTTLLSGTPATAKTIFGLEFLINGA
jgi:circadian clock protein KaiC